MNYQARQKKLLDRLDANHLDALLVTHLPNIRYLCGFTGSSGALLLSAQGSIFFSDGRYRSQATAEVEKAKIAIRPTGPVQSAAEWTAENRKQLGWRAGAGFTLGVEAEHLSAALTRQLQRTLPRGCKLRYTSMLVEGIRALKDKEEMARLRAAVRLGCSLFEIARRTIAAGIRESEVAAELEYEARLRGAEAMSFPSIVASGKRSALPHGVASRAAIPSRGFVVCDFGVILAGYCSDMTRTVHVGRPTVEAQRVYAAVLEAQLAAIAAAGDGVSVREIDEAARKSLQKVGLASYFSHSTGHGVGLEIHEAPRIAASRSETLRAGMVVTIEPGVYIPGNFGVRIEDMIVVTEQGCEVLTTAPKQFMLL